MKSKIVESMGSWVGPKLKELEENMRSRILILEELRDSCLNNLRKAPVGSLKASRHGKGFQYHHRTEKSGSNGEYIPKRDRGLAKDLAQKEYAQKLLKSVEAEIKALQRALSSFPNIPAEDIYDSFPDSKKCLIEPFYETADQLKERWASIEYEGNFYHPVNTGLETDRGEEVRSKSELYIANRLFLSGVPYRYEYPIWLEEYGTAYPDFVILNVRERREIVWEHLGMMDEPEYAAKAVRKLAAYESNGYYMGENLIVTMETKEQPLDVRQVKRLIKSQCM